MRPDAETLAQMLTALTGPDDQFASHDDAVRMATWLLDGAEKGDVTMRHIVMATVNYLSDPDDDEAE